MIKKPFYLLLPAICFILYGCPGGFKEDKSPINWSDQYSIQFNTIRLKVGETYRSVDGSFLKLYPDTYENEFGTIKDFCKVFEPYNGNIYDPGNSKIKAKTDIPSYFKRNILYSGDNKEKEYTKCTNGLTANIINGYVAKNRDLDMQTLEMTIISGPYLNSSNREGNLYWYKTIYGSFNQSYTINNSIVQVGSFKQEAAFKPISSTPIIVTIYRDDMMVSQAVQMIERTNGKELILATVK